MSVHPLQVGSGPEQVQKRLASLGLIQEWDMAATTVTGHSVGTGLVIAQVAHGEVRNFAVHFPSIGG